MLQGSSELEYVAGIVHRAIAELRADDTRLRQNVETRAEQYQPRPLGTVILRLLDCAAQHILDSIDCDGKRVCVYYCVVGKAQPAQLF